MIKKIKDFFKTNTRIALLILFLLELFINIWITPNKYDSAFFIEKMQEMSVFDFVGMRYQTWTSRILIETIVCLVLPHRFVWVILNTIMTTLIGYSLIRLFVKKDDKNLIWMILCLILIYPIYKVASCDWGAGTINYTWILAMLLFACIPIRRIIDGEKIKKWMYLIYSLALIFACNQEQACMIAFGIYFVFTLLEFFKNKKKVHPFMIVQCILIILSLIFIATCPGNYARKNEEILTYNMDFRVLNVFDKISLGLTSTVNNLLVRPNIVFLTFSIVLAVYVSKIYKNNLYRAVALIPLVAQLVLSLFKNIVDGIFPIFGVFYEIIFLEQPMLTPGNYTDFINFLPLILSLVILGSIAMSILLIFKNLKNNVAILVYALGVASRIILGFSPTIFASTDRTFLFFEYSLIIVTILIWREYLKQTDKNQVKVRDRLSTVLVIFAVLQYLHTFIYTLMSQM